MLTNGFVVEFQICSCCFYMDMETRQIDTTIGCWLDIDVIKISGHNICFYSVLDPTRCVYKQQWLEIRIKVQIE